ncbi:MAG: hypothetical protein B6D63_03300 [Candidatus Latescibacteria bacterium 4484_7]|nr:MAG: hypothetical protein B6D63_03300 [Candidatus Latescibacteria bacterium 4484_7]
MFSFFLFAEALIISFVLTRLILRVSIAKNLLDIPNERSSHSIPKPRLGGIAIAAAFYITVSTAFIVGHVVIVGSSAMLGLLGGAGVLLLMGVVDDVRGIGAIPKLLFQIAAASVAVTAGAVLKEITIPLIGTLNLGAFGIPFTILWIVAIINFYNFIDGIDGLAAGVAVIGALFLAFLAGKAEMTGLFVAYIILAGSALGFLKFNFPPARIFMGDTGSAFIGFLFAVLSVLSEGRGASAFLTVIVLGAVFGDAAVTLIRRMIRAESILTPHKTHYYQRLTTLGLSHKQVTIIEYLITALLGVGAVFAYEREMIFVVFFAAVWIFFFFWVLAKVRSLERGKRLAFEGHPVLIAAGDIAFVALSYFLSYYLRLNFRFPHEETRSMLISLPIVLIIRSAVFHMYGLYKGVWRYTTFDDLMRIVKAVTLGSAVMIVTFVLLFRLKSFPRSVFIIDWFILTVFMTGSRAATRWFHELPKGEDIVGKRVLIVGTGNMAELILQDLSQYGGMIPIGFVDDRVDMFGRMIHGLKVHGPISRLEDIATMESADAIVVLQSLVGRITEESRSRLQSRGVEFKEIDDLSLSVGTNDTSFEPIDLFKDRNVLMIGNGRLTRNAHLLSGMSALTIVSDDTAVLVNALDNRIKVKNLKRYIGDTADRRFIYDKFERSRAEVVVVDFDIRFIAIADNPYEAFLQKVVRPVANLLYASAEGEVREFYLICSSVKEAPEGEMLCRLIYSAVADGLPGSSEVKALMIDSDHPRSLTALLMRLSNLRDSGIYRVEFESTVDGTGGMQFVPVEGVLPAGNDVGRMLRIDRISSLDGASFAVLVEHVKSSNMVKQNG